MATGTYGTKKPANITADDADVFYSYRETREELPNSSNAVMQPLYDNPTNSDLQKLTGADGI